MLKKKIRSLDKNFVGNIFLKKPDKYRELENFTKNTENLMTMGSFKSYTAASFKENNLSLQFSKFNRIIKFDKVNKTIIVEAGIKLSDLLNFTLKHNLWIPQIPGYPTISLGGCVAANVHGKSSDKHGTIRSQIKSIKIFHKINGWLTLSETENKEIFELTIGGFGLTGTIVNVELKLIELKNINFITTIEKTYSIKDSVNKLNFQDNENIFCYSWNKTGNNKKFGEGLIFKNKVVNDNLNNIYKNIDFGNADIHNFFPFNLWNIYSIKLFQNIFFNYHNFYKTKSSKNSFKDVLFPYAGKEAYFYMFGKNGLIESQILVPFKKIENFVDELNYNIKKIKPEITLFSIKKIKDTESYLRFSGEGFCFTFDFVNNKKNLNFLDTIDKICIKYNLKPSIIKDSRLGKNIIKECYDGYEKFKNDLLNFDNKKTYRSELSKRIGL